MSAKVSNDFSTHTRKDSCRSNSCVSACPCGVSASRHSAPSCRRSRIRRMIVPHSCAWQKPSSHFLPACAALQRRLASLNVRKSCDCWLKTFWWAKIRLRFVTAFQFPQAHPQTKDRALQSAEITFCVRGVISPLLSNLYLNEVDRMLERAKAVTRHERWTGVEYARFADDLVILVNSHPRQQWLRQAVEKRLREELAKLLVEVNEEKSRKVDLQRGESFGFLGFEFRRVRSRRGRWMPLLLPKSKKRTALLSKLKEIFRKFRSQPVGQVIEKINPILRGWVKYFAIGHSSRCFSYIQNWVEMKIRRHLARACQRRGFGWKRWSREWLYDTLRLFSEYRVSYVPSFSAVVPN